MKHITISVFAISALFISNVYAYSPFGSKSPDNPFSEYGSPFGKYSPNNPFSEYGSPFGKYSPNNPFSDGVGPAYDR